MKPRALMAVNGLPYIVYGIGLTLITVLMVVGHGVTLGPDPMIAGPILGAVKMGVGLANWTAGNASDIGTRALVLGNFVFHLLGWILVSVAGLSGLISALGWLSVATHPSPAIGFGRFGYPGFMQAQSGFFLKEVNNMNPIMKNLRTTGEAFLRTLLARDFKKLGALLGPDVKFRALLPPGSFEWSGPAAVIENLASWFGSAEDFEVLDSQVEEVNGRLRLAYKFRLRPHPFNPGSGWHVIEQQLFCDGGAEALVGIDLLCSGFLPEIESK